MPVNLLRRIFALLIVTAYVGATMLQVAPTYAASSDMSRSSMAGMMHEPDGYPWNGLFVHWHGSGNGKMITAANLKRDPERFIAPTSFVDGHARACNFTSAFKNNPNRPMEETKDWIWYKARGN